METIWFIPNEVTSFEKATLLVAIPYSVAEMDIHEFDQLERTNEMSALVAVIERAETHEAIDEQAGIPVPDPKVSSIARAQLIDLVDSLSWALDLLDMYDKRMVQLGDPAEKVYSQVHVNGKADARAAVSAIGVI